MASYPRDPESSSDDDVTQDTSPSSRSGRMIADDLFKYDPSFRYSTLERDDSQLSASGFLPPTPYSSTLDFSPRYVQMPFLNPHGQRFSMPIFDMRKSAVFSRGRYDTLSAIKSVSKEELIQVVSEKMKVEAKHVHIIEEDVKKEGTKKKTFIVILPQCNMEDVRFLIFEAYEFIGKITPTYICGRFKSDTSMMAVKTQLAKELKWKDMALCVDLRVVNLVETVHQHGFINLDRVQVIQMSSHSVRFCHKPSADVDVNFTLEIDLSDSVKDVKELFETRFEDKLERMKAHKNQHVHFSIQDKLLEDDLCIGLVFNSREEVINVHLCEAAVISLNVKFRKPLKLRQKLLIMPANSSTEFLREEISKLLPTPHDPKAIKITLNGGLIDEHDNLVQHYGNEWVNGTTISVGIKKCKTLRVKNPLDKRELKAELYMLESVSKLKREIADAFDLKEIQISLICRELRMESTRLLQHYPIKNNMEIMLKVFKHRMVVQVVIIFLKRKRVNLIVDDSSKTTVDELLKFCAHAFQYRRSCSRAIFDNRCLDRRLTLQQEGIQHGDKVLGVNFNQHEAATRELIPIFMAHPRGHVIQRVGSVQGGLLLHAPKTQKMPDANVREELTSRPPEGIKICYEPADKMTRTLCCPRQEEESKQSDNSDLLMRSNKDLKLKFLKQAKKVREKILCKSLAHQRARGELQDETTTEMKRLASPCLDVIAPNYELDDDKQFEACPNLEGKCEDISILSVGPNSSLLFGEQDKGQKRLGSEMENVDDTMSTQTKAKFYLESTDSLQNSEGKMGQNTAPKEVFDRSQSLSDFAASSYSSRKQFGIHPTDSSDPNIFSDPGTRSAVGHGRPPSGELDGKKVLRSTTNIPGDLAAAARLPELSVEEFDDEDDDPNCSITQLKQEYKLETEHSSNIDIENPNTSRKEVAVDHRDIDKGWDSMDTGGTPEETESGHMVGTSTKHATLEEDGLKNGDVNQKTEETDKTPEQESSLTASAALTCRGEVSMVYQTNCKNPRYKEIFEKNNGIEKCQNRINILENQARESGENENNGSGNSSDVASDNRLAQSYRGVLRRTNESGNSSEIASDNRHSQSNRGFLRRQESVSDMVRENGPGTPHAGNSDIESASTRPNPLMREQASLSREETSSVNYDWVMCPYHWQTNGATPCNEPSCHYVQQQIQQRQVQLVDRNRGSSESQIDVLQLANHYQSTVQIHHNVTYPSALVHQQFVPNQAYNTAGITTGFLNAVSKELGNKWKQLLRELELDENTIVAAESNNYRDLEEMTYQALLKWKLQEGQAGTRRRVLEALVNIGLRGVAEKVTSGYQTL